MSDSVIDLSPVAGVEALDALVPGRSLPLGLLEPPDMWLDFADGAVVLRLTAWVEPATASAYEVEPPNGVYVTLALGGVRFEPLSETRGDMPSLTAAPGACSTCTRSSPASWATSPSPGPCREPAAPTGGWPTNSTPRPTPPARERRAGRGRPEDLSRPAAVL